VLEAWLILQALSYTMPRFQFEIAIVLAVSIACSLAVFYLTRPEEGKIQLPTHVESSEEAYHGPDPFDVTKPEDIIDGYPIGADAFWARVRWSELLEVLYV